MANTILVMMSPKAPSMEICDVIGETDKALRLRNRDNGAECWAAKSGLKLRKPGEPTYENEYVLAGWFRDKLDARQERVFGIRE